GAPRRRRGARRRRARPDRARRPPWSWRRRRGPRGRGPVNAAPGPIRTRTRMRRAVAAAAAALLGAAALAGCDISAAHEQPVDGRTGPRTAVLEDENVYPVAEDPQPQLPVTVRSWDGVDVTVTDVSRIVTVDLYGTL